MLTCGCGVHGHALAALVVASLVQGEDRLGSWCFSTVIVIIILVSNVNVVTMINNCYNATLLSCSP